MKTPILNKLSLTAKFVNTEVVSLTIRDLTNGQTWVYTIQFRQSDNKSVAEQVIEELVNDDESSSSDNSNESLAEEEENGN